MGGLVERFLGWFGFSRQECGPGDDWMVLDHGGGFQVVYLENRGFEPASARWFAFTAVIAGKQGPLLCAYQEGYYMPPTILAGNGDSKEAAWEQLAVALETAYAAMVYNGYKPMLVERPRRSCPPSASFEVG